jgi:nicotinate-nucleotide pyrophosphorylase (carboxylating)
VNEVVRLALEEDIGAGDITTLSCVPAGRRASGVFIAREDLVLAGMELLGEIYAVRGGVESLNVHHGDGEQVRSGQTIATVVGPARTLLECERVALNFLQRLSGVATLARKFADQVTGTACRVLDTRKTTPGLRMLEKAAAAAGGVTNHRQGLFDAILIKNNHIAAAGSVTAALANTRDVGLAVEIEVRTEAELREALEAGATHLLLDNLTPAEAREWIGIIDSRAAVELSGNITLETVRAYAETGADFVSSGSITHSARAVDLSFRLTLLDA